MSKQQPLDMTRGNPLPILVRFAIPLILGSLFQQLYSFVDTAIVGRCIGAEAQASIEYLSIISTLFIFHGSLMIFRNTVQGMGYAASTLASAVMEIIGRSAAGLLAVHFGSFFLICVSAPMAWTLACICCIGLCMYYIPKADREFAGITK